MKATIFLSTLLFLGLAQASGFEDFFETFRDQVESQGRFELSAALGDDYQSLLRQSAFTTGLEQISSETLILEKEFQEFIDELFETPYVIPHFCYNFRGFERNELWSMRAQNISQLCKLKVVTLLRPLLGGEYANRTIFLHGTNSEGDYKKARFIAEDFKRKRSLVVNFDVVMD